MPPAAPGCPFCRKVREAVAILDLDVKFMPCPKVRREGGKEPRAPEEQWEEQPAVVAAPCVLRRILRLPTARGYSLLAASLVPAGLLQDGPTWRPEAVGKSGKRQFPYMEVRACWGAGSHGVCLCACGSWVRRRGMGGWAVSVVAAGAASSLQTSTTVGVALWGSWGGLSAGDGTPTPATQLHPTH